MSIHITEISDKIKVDWEPQAIVPEKALADVICSDDFQTRLGNMLDGFQKLEPTYIEAYGQNYVSMAERNQLLESNFDVGTFWFRYDFVNRQANDPVCVCTLYVLTDDGYLPWFNRMGQATSADTGSDGAFADAETSARRRVLIALGMGSEGDLEIKQAQNSGASTAIQGQLDKEGLSIVGFLRQYASDAASLGLPKLVTSLKELSKSSELSWADVSSTDLDNLLSYAKKKFKGMSN